MLAATGATKVVLVGTVARRLPDPQLHRRRRCRPGLACHPRRRAEPWRLGHQGLPAGQRVQRHRTVPDAAQRPPGPEGNEVTPGVEWLTIRSDNNDKYAQPDGVWLGQRGTADQRRLRRPGAERARENVVIAGIDHRETALGPKAFAEMWRFLTGQPPRDADDRAGSERSSLDGKRERPRPRQPRRQLRHQPAAGRRLGRGLCDPCDQRRAARPGAARPDDRRRRRRRGPFVAADAGASAKFVTSRYAARALSPRPSRPCARRAPA